jgi:hypothetical protein
MQLLHWFGFGLTYEVPGWGILVGRFVKSGHSIPATSRDSISSAPACQYLDAVGRILQAAIGTGSLML